MANKPKILIIGGGIGGLTVGIALQQAGFRIEIFERAEELREIGAGIGLSPNAVRVLKHLGLMQRVVDRGTMIEAGVSYNSRGDTIGRMPTNLSDVPSVCLHRADLQQVLFSALDPNGIHFGEQFVDFDQSDDGIAAHFATGRTATGDALIGADGLRSRVRTQLIGDGEPVYRGYQCWRGVCDQPASRMLTETFGLGLRVGLVPIGLRGTAWWCTANEADLAIDEANDTKPKLLRWFGKWHAPIPDVFAATDPAAIIKTGIYDRRPAMTWSGRRCTLLGDAAHPTTPNMGQGGCMAIEDAIVLARCLSNHSDPATAFGIYQRLRYARTAKVINISRFYGVIGQWKSPGAAWLRNTGFRLSYLLGAGKVAAKGYARFVSYDPYKISLNGS